MTPAPASAIIDEGYFRKRGGKYVFKKLSVSSVKHLGLKADQVYGVCFNGNTAVVDCDKMVVPCTAFEFFANIKSEAAWNLNIAGRHVCPYCGDDGADVEHEVFLASMVCGACGQGSRLPLFGESSERATEASNGLGPVRTVPEQAGDGVPD